MWNGGSLLHHCSTLLNSTTGQFSVRLYKVTQPDTNSNQSPLLTIFHYSISMVLYLLKRQTWYLIDNAREDSSVFVYLMGRRSLAPERAAWQELGADPTCGVESMVHGPAHLKCPLSLLHTEEDAVRVKIIDLQIQNNWAFFCILL